MDAPRVYAVAALSANIRALPSIRSKVVGTLERGATLVALDHRDGFIKLRISGDVEGWISSDIVIDKAELARLQSVSPADYIAARERFMPIERLTEHRDRISPLVGALLRQVEGRQGDVASTISVIESYERPTSEADGAAGLWFSLAARAAANVGDHNEATRLTTAAIYAEPLNADHHTALGFSAIAMGQRELLQVTATMLLSLAPGSTNTWVIVGVNAAHSGNADLVNGAIRLALERSRNRATTVRVLRGMATRADDPAVAAALSGALAAAMDTADTGGAARSN